MSYPSHTPVSHNIKYRFLIFFTTGCAIMAGQPTHRVHHPIASNSSLGNVVRPVVSLHHSCYDCALALLKKFYLAKVTRQFSSLNVKPYIHTFNVDCYGNQRVTKPWERKATGHIYLGIASVQFSIIYTKNEQYNIILLIIIIG